MLLGNPALHRRIACSVLHMFAMYLFVSSPSSLSLDPDTDVVPEADAAPRYDYAVDDQILAAELPGKQTPLFILISPISFPFLLALEFFATTAIPILMHSLIL